MSNLMLNFSMYAKIEDPSGESKAFNPVCPAVSPVSASGGIPWSREEDFCTSVSSLPSHHDNCKGMGCIKAILRPTLLLKTVFLDTTEAEKGAHKLLIVSLTFLPVPVSKSSSNPDHPATMVAAAGE